MGDDGTQSRGPVGNGGADGAGGADRLAAAQAEFRPETTYLDSATAGLPPARALRALAQAQERWAAGRVDARGYDVPVEAARAGYAGLVGVRPADVAVGSQVSAFVGVVAASLPDGCEVVVAEGDFTSVLFPFHAQAGRGVRVREVPLEELPQAAADGAELVACSAVQSADGRVADLDALAAGADASGCRVLLDTTQATGWLPVEAARFAYTVGGGYKWLLAPRGTCFATVHPDEVERLVPQAAGWYAGADRWSSIYGGPLRLAESARRFDVSPAWHSWVGQAASLELLTEVGTATLHAHALGLADRARAGLGLPPGNSAILSLDVPPEALEELAGAGVVGSVRAGRLRVSFHVHNTAADVDRLLGCLEPHARAGRVSTRKLSPR
ncbi:selenocysteine lyase/cysteine desulfurase [Kineococcus xinjiangensis]|uniref:Selenocysteine lyase/cysteine desulfurase n=1 Tax=Kineococcus xinjiangensis TaxID=512762 RepID=A0A2S6IVR3_9ACTN|nr:aminotransferase class V-fold PLP-dependent enzyme [Kineococcus xinjiangensis]PPK98449.1 selenocysteine lyase/cysteine desulfurase [Kineococcus xinjiangensis]